ncbi:hypothetical protein [Dactylosporangium sp. CA-233914]|uniref:hypothetical protein n=1 Tax=Dactylosporangium sp. CA-233914 TaxID=3239934 RepID=UPI003D8AF3EE
MTVGRVLPDRPRVLTNAWVRERSARLRAALGPCVRSPRFWAVLGLGLLFAAAAWIAVTGWLAHAERRPGPVPVSAGVRG